MKKVIKISSSIALVFLLSFTLSSFTTNLESVENNGVDVVVVKDGMRWYVAGCEGGPLYAEKSTDQYKNGVLHMSTYIFKVPEECWPAPKKAEKYDLYPGAYYIHTPSGNIIVKEIHN